MRRSIQPFHRPTRTLAALALLAVAPACRPSAGAAGDSAAATSTGATSSQPAAPPSGKTPALREVTNDARAIWEVDSATAARYHDRLHFDPSLARPATIQRTHDDITTLVRVVLIPESRSHRVGGPDLANGGRLVYAVILADSGTSVPDLGLDGDTPTAYLWVGAPRSPGDSIHEARYVVREPNGRFTPHLAMLVKPISKDDQGKAIPRPVVSEVRWGRHHTGIELTTTAREWRQAMGFPPDTTDHRPTCFACDEGWCLVSETFKSTQ